MFVCAGLIHDNYASTITNTGNIVVFFKEAQVLPCALVTFQNGLSGEQNLGAIKYYDHLVSKLGAYKPVMPVVPPQRPFVHSNPTVGKTSMKARRLNKDQRNAARQKLKAAAASASDNAPANLPKKGSSRKERQKASSRSQKHSSRR